MEKTGRIIVRKADITRMRVGAIVNPANSSGSMGGGVALAIKRAGGDIIEKEAMGHAPIRVGQAVKTTAGKLKAGWVIHAPTMRFPAMKIRPVNVRKATAAALGLAGKESIRTLAFPGMGTGVGCVSYPEAAEAMVGEIEKRKHHFDRIFLVGLDRELVKVFREAHKKAKKI